MTATPTIGSLYRSRAVGGLHEVRVLSVACGVVRYAPRRVGPGEPSESLTVEAFAAAFEPVPAEDPDAGPRSWRVGGVPVDDVDADDKAEYQRDEDDRTDDVDAQPPAASAPRSGSVRADGNACAWVCACRAVDALVDAARHSGLTPDTRELIARAVAAAARAQQALDADGVDDDGDERDA